ncbi:hypothetical protein HFN63_36990 [Rhizobium leguminosarum]|uniref:TfuA-like protein n=1 Tax=Rhizobium leguminosarum TaxID=384 RepID=UPI001C988E6A|nr:TfuA-like protein [Rhizobium leguminosarum]MBY5775500.1 hypothetical protein [Rhizobium leguminosarum]
MYQNFAPLRHKEIVAHLAMGVRIFGSASYGALRASELHALGVVPLGGIAGAYCDGLISDDGEVAVLHSPETHHGRLTAPMVSVRFTIARLLDDRLFDASEAAEILSLLSNVNFSRRTVSTIRQVLQYSGVARHADLFLHELCDKPDIKAEDAKQAILYVDQLGEHNDADRSSIRWQSAYAKAGEFIR